MAAKQESKQHYLGRNRPPRVQITYDVEIGNAFETRELPLVVGILSDLSGNVAPNKDDPDWVSLDKRSFVDIDRDSFDTVLKKIKPALSLGADTSLNGAGLKLPVELKFESIEDFSPDRIVTQVEELKGLFEKRRALQDLLIKLDGNEELDQVLGDGLSSTKSIGEFQKQLADAKTPKALPGKAEKAEKPEKSDEQTGESGDTETTQN